MLLIRGEEDRRGAGRKQRVARLPVSRFHKRAPDDVRLAFVFLSRSADNGTAETWRARPNPTSWAPRRSERMEGRDAHVRDSIQNGIRYTASLTGALNLRHVGRGLFVQSPPDAIPHEMSAPDTFAERWSFPHSSYRVVVYLPLCGLA